MLSAPGKRNSSRRLLAETPSLLNKGYYLTVCHHHPRVLHVFYDSARESMDPSLHDLCCRFGAYRITERCKKSQY